MKIGIILGTRPEIVKLASVMRDLVFRRADFFIVHTGQHYSYNLGGVFFEQLELPRPKHNLDTGSGSHAEETAKMLVGIEKVLIEEKPDIVLVQGDTNSVLAGALAAAKLGIKIGHVEAGLRSYNRAMPEEINRILVDHLADYLFVPTLKSKNILVGEGISEKHIFVTGNTIVDAVYQNRNIIKKREHILNALNLETGGYFLVTLHRQENVDNPAILSSILEGMSDVGKEFGQPVVCPLHPRTRHRLREFALPTKSLVVMDPLDYLDFLLLESQARLIITDSGGVQEEACILRIPCVTMRDNTERPETLDVGANILAGSSPGKILECVKIMLQRERKWANPFGDGRAGERIIKLIVDSCDIH